MTQYIGNASVLDMVDIPNMLSEQEADLILAANWDWLEPRCSANVFEVFQLLNVCACECGNASVRNSGASIDPGCQCDISNPDGNCP